MCNQCDLLQPQCELHVHVYEEQFAVLPLFKILYVYMIKINEPQLPWLQTTIYVYHTGLDVKIEVTQWCITIHSTCIASTAFSGYQGHDYY